MMTGHFKPPCMELRRFVPLIFEGLCLVWGRQRRGVLGFGPGFKAWDMRVLQEFLAKAI